ncbi:Cu_bind_like domain-containing protein [Cephalotus follicularis]|uniref:Cu_bind_like domain-containing protein n=1 Tax=Cephalotus follicularis TaxID=3775 RepID=A0A1Q3ATT9_CEPFO|nr:Cu_bind_like domain-containing protein [Cephalotus follicularis]
MAIATALLILLLASPAVHAVQYTVGDSAGWTQMSYNSWLSGKTFTVGDSLVFNYDSSTHKVDQVSQSDYNNCASSNAINSYSDGSTTISLDKAGSMYFICPTIGHCAGGMKLAVNVLASTTTPSGTPPTTTSGTPTGTPPTTTTSGTPSTPSPTLNGAATTIVNMNNLMLGSLLVLGAMLAVMG